MVHNVNKTCWLCGGTIDNKTAEKLGTPVTDLSLSTRALNCLHWAKIEYIEQLLSFYSQIYRIKNMGKVTLNEIHEKVKAFGIDWDLTRKNPLRDLVRVNR